MAYIKLNEVELIEKPVEPNLLIEDDGNIKRTPASKILTPHIQADWNEDDATKPGFILNKPESLGGKVVTYTFESSGVYSNGVIVNAQKILDEWNSGSTLRIAISSTEESNVVNVSYTMVSGALSTVKLVYLDDTGAPLTKTV